ncbi:MAG: SDR family NAD(P)-dependent oxidoreductase [Nitrospinales bacterium]
MASEKANLIITARSKEKLESLAGDLERVYSIRVYVYPMDLSEEGSAKGLYDKIKESGHSIDVLINNAAFGKSGKFLDADMKLYKSMIMLNLNSLVELSYLCLPEMLQKKRWGNNQCCVHRSFFAVPIFHNLFCYKVVCNVFF